MVAKVAPLPQAVQYMRPWELVVVVVVVVVPTLVTMIVLTA